MNYPSFAEFFSAVNDGHQPLPWQERLARQVVGTGEWPRAIGVPTGLGKTSCLEVALWGLGHQATSGAQRSLPLRTWYTAPRRLLVDKAWERALQLQAFLASPESAASQSGLPSPEGAVAALKAVATALGGLAVLGSDAGPLHVVRLRGGADLDARSPDPTQPVLFVATVQAFVSRFLFRGFGTSTGMRPVDAALAGTDSLVLADEAHLTQALANTLHQAAEADFPAGPAVLAERLSRPVLVELSATGQGAGFGLDEDDLAHPLVEKRVNAAKETRFHSFGPKRDLSDVMADDALGFLARPDGLPATVLVFASTVALAQRTGSALQNKLADGKTDAEVMVVTGRLRDREADLYQRALSDPATGIAAGRPLATPRKKPLLVVATQTLEVGADFDADYLVTDTPSAASLVQRFGRLNRFGDRPWAKASICWATPGNESDRGSPVYGTVPTEVAAILVSQPDVFSMAPHDADSLFSGIKKDAGYSPQVMPSLLWEWAKTSGRVVGEAPAELYANDLSEPERLVTVLWRANVPEPGQALLPPVGHGEGVDLPIAEVRDFLSERGQDAVARLGPTGDQLERAELWQIGPGDVLVLPANWGGYGQDGWAPSSTDEVVDVSLLCGGYFPVTTGSLANLAVYDEQAERLVSFLRSDEVDDHAGEQVLAMLSLLTPRDGLQPDEWRAFLEHLTSVLMWDEDVPVLKAQPRKWLVGTARVRPGVFAELGIPAESRYLHDHLLSVGHTARLLATRLGLAEHLVDALGWAGELHDIGKLDPRVQAWFDPTGNAVQPVAKSDYDRVLSEQFRSAAGWPKGGRHELLSARIARQLGDDGKLEATVDHKLVVHLILTHHGWGRPWVPVVDSTTGATVTATVGSQTVTVDANMALPTWDQPARFRRLSERYGNWGLALLETILRQADGAVSQAAGR